MKRGVLLCLVLMLVACGGDEEPTPTVLSVDASPTTAPVAAAPATPSATPPAVESTTESPGPTPPPAGPLPLLVDETTLGPDSAACAGEGLIVADDGTVYILGQRDGQPCASAIDLKAGALTPVDPSALSPPDDAPLEITDATRGRVYVVEGDTVVAYDASGQEIGPVLDLPPGEPGGFGSVTALRLDETAGRLYVSYQDFDGQTWIALSDLNTPANGAQAVGQTITDVAVPAGPWELTADDQLLFADASTLVVLDGSTLELTDRLSLSRSPADAGVDVSGDRLFVADAGGDLHVLDALSLDEIDRLPGLGAALDLDPRLNRLYVGDRYSGGVHVFDLATLEPLGRIPQPGRPVASPADGQVYIVEESVYQADGATLELITGRTTRSGGCNGCATLGDVVVDPGSGLVYTTTFSVGGGKPGPTSQVAVDPRGGRAFIARTTGGYQPVYSLAIYPDLSLGQPTRWLDGLYGQPLFDPASEQLYLARQERLLVLDGQTLELLGGLRLGEGLTLLAVDAQSGRLFAAQGQRLLRFEAGGAPLDAAGLGQGPSPSIGQLPGPVYGIAVSPAFAQDATLFARATDLETGRADLYRSRDGGQSWVRLRGGLPGPPNDLVFAPQGRLYAALAGVEWHTAAETAIWGEGVYLSGDGGDTWHPANRGLTHLRVGRLHVVGEGTLYALAASAPEPGHAASGPAIWTRPPGGDWTLLPVPDAGPLRLEDYAIPTGYVQAVQARWHELTRGGPLYQAWSDELRRSDDGGVTWRAAGPGPADYADDVVGSDDGGSVYWVGPEALWRSTDDGATWTALRHPALDGPPFTVVLADVDGAETLFLGTVDGQLLVVPATEAEWELPTR